MMIVQARLAQYLRANGIKGSFIVKKTGIRQSKLSEILNGHIALKADDLEKICNAIKADPNEFINVQAE